MTHLTTDALDQVAAYRPTDEVLDTAWPADRRCDVLDRIRSAPDRVAGRDLAATRRNRRRWTVAGASAAVAAVAAAVTVLGTSAPPPTSSTVPATASPAPSLQLLAALVAAEPVTAIRSGQYWHRVLRERLGPHNVSVRESWTAPSGRVWRKDVEAGTRSYLEFPPGDGSFYGFTPATLRHMPTRTGALEQYLRRNAQASSSKAEAIFDAVGLIVGSGYAPADLRAASLRVLQRVGHVTVSNTVDALGRPAFRADFVDEVHRPDEVQSLLFDANTTALLETRTHVDFPGGSCPPPPPRKARPGAAPKNCPADHESYTGTYTVSNVVNRLPRKVRERAVLQHG